MDIDAAFMLKGQPRLLFRLIRLVGAFTLVASLFMGVFAGLAHATVANVTASNSQVSQATGARTVYVIGFTAGTTLTSTSQSTGTITITLPNGTDLSQIGTVNITDTTTNTLVGNFCAHTATGVNPPVLTCNIFSGSTVRVGDSVAITVDEVINPTTTQSNPTISLFTSSETTPVSSPNSGNSANYQIVGQNPITNVTASNSQVSQAAGARTIYTVGFKTSPTGGLAGNAGSQFTITLPNGTDLSQIGTVNITDTTTNTLVGNFCAHTATGVNPPVLTCNIFSGSTVHAGDVVTATVNEITNPTTLAANPTLTVATTSDTAAVSSPNSGNSANYQIVGQNPITNVTASNSQVSQAAGARTIYTVGFKTSPTGGLAGNAGSQFTITLPNGTDLSQIGTVNITDTTTNTLVGNFCAHTATGVNPPVLTCNIFSGSAVNAGDVVTATVNEITNPTTLAANPTLTVATTSDTAAVSSPNSGNSANYQIVGQNPITNVTASNSQVSQAAGARTIYTVGFKTSPTGGLAGNAGSQFTITLPNGTDLSQIGTVNITDTTTNTLVGNFCAHTATGVNPPVLTCNIFSGSAVNAGDVVTATVNEITNPTTLAANPTVTVATTSDTAAVSSPNSGNSANYQIVAGQQISATSVALSNQAPSAAGVTYIIGFKTSSTGGLAGNAGSQFTITLPNGTDLSQIGTVNITDTTTNTLVGNFCAHTATGVNPPVLTCNIFSGSTAGPPHVVTVTVNGIINPPAAASETAQISTTSDLPSVAGSYTIGGNPPPPTVTSISPTSGPAAGGTAVTINGANFTGATVVFGATSASVTSNTGTQMTVIAPPGSGTVDVVVTNAGGKSATSAADQFTYNAPAPAAPPPSSAASAPIVAGGSPTNQTSSGAGLSGSVDPENLATTAFFQYGLDPSYRGPGASTTLYDQSTPLQQVGSDAASHTVSAALAGLVPGALYHFRLVATNSAGTTFGPDQTFTTPQATAPPPPVLGQTENAQPISGTVFIRLPSGAFVRLTGAQKIPSGTEVDALNGSLQITTATAKKGKTQTGVFGGAVFKLTQASAGATKGLATLSLIEGAFKGAPSYSLCTKHKAADPSAAAASVKTLQLLHASAHGKFRTKGRYSAATVLGTRWTIADRCDGTLTHDITDSVQVNDFVHHKTITLHAGQSYLAKAKP